MNPCETLPEQLPAGLESLWGSISRLGSLDPQNDLQAVVSHENLRHMLAEEAYRLLMEPVYHFQQEGWKVAVTVFRPLRDMSAMEVYNWMLYFKCLDVDYDEFEDVSLVLDPDKRNWRILNSTLRDARLFLTPNKDRLFQDGLGGDQRLVLEYVTVPKSLLPTEVVRAGYVSSTVRKSDLVIAWDFPDDPVRSWHR